jgi:hypothetical protein
MTWHETWTCELCKAGYTHADSAVVPNSERNRVRLADEEAAYSQLLVGTCHRYRWLAQFCIHKPHFATETKRQMLVANTVVQKWNCVGVRVRGFEVLVN